MSHIKSHFLLIASFIFFATIAITRYDIAHAKTDEPSIRDCTWICDLNSAERESQYRDSKYSCQQEQFEPIPQYMQIASTSCPDACYLEHYEDICEKNKSCGSVISSCDFDKYKKESSNQIDIFENLSLTNTSRNIGNGKWEWTAFISGPSNYLTSIESVTYYLHPTFTPNVYKGDSSQLGHPFTTTGWGPFELKADVNLKNGQYRMYFHMLRFQ